MKSSTQDKMEGHAKDIKGQVKETAGNVVNDPKLRQEGREDQLEGKTQKKVGDVKKVFDR